MARGGSRQARGQSLRRGDWPPHLVIARRRSRRGNPVRRLPLVPEPLDCFVVATPRNDEGEG